MRKNYNFRRNKTGYLVKPLIAVLCLFILLFQSASAFSEKTSDPFIKGNTAGSSHNKILPAFAFLPGGNFIQGAGNNYLVTVLNRSAVFSLTVDVNGNGTVTKDPDQTDYDGGLNVVLTAVPAAGQQFTGWSGDATGTTNPLTLSMDGNKSVSANFAPVQYHLTVNTNGNGTVSKDPDNSDYNSGSNVILTATPASGQQFTGWSGGASGTTNPLTVSMDGDKTITANFASVEYNLSVGTNGNGTVTKDPNQASYTSGSNVTLTAVPSAGQQFTGWSGSASGTTNPLTISMDGDKTITANFAPIQYNLTVAISGNGTVSKNPDQATYTSGASVTLTATPATGQQFSGWSGAATGTTNPLTITMDGDKTVTATFTPIQYSLTVAANGNGTVSKNPDQAAYTNGTTVILTATPATGQQFTGWSGSASGTTNPLTVTVDANKDITANFSPIQYNLSVSTSGNGTVTKSPDQSTYASGTSVTLTAVPAAGQQFTGWSGAATGTTNPLTITIDGDKSVTANFVPIQYSLSVSINGNGTVSKNPDQATYASGTSVTLTATPAAGQQFTGWSGAATGTANPLTVTLDGDKSVTATFAPVQYTLTVATSGNGTVAKNPDQATYASGTSVTLTATPAAGQQFTGWSGAATGTVNPLTIVMDGDKSVTATFAPAPPQFNLTVGVNGNGTVSKNPDQANYTSGTNVTLTATPAAGQQFTGWSGAATGTTNPLTVTMDGDKSITANFAPIQYVLTININGNGTVSKNPDQATYASGTSVTLTATPGTGQQFTGWSGDATGSTNPLTITMDAARSVTATFAPIQYSLNVTTTGSGSVSKNPNQATYASGTSVILTATPVSGQQFTGWSGDATGTTNPLTITITGNKSIVAHFTQSSTGIITNVASTTGHSYALGQLNTGTVIYTDRTYQTTSVPSILNNAPFIKTPNDDKGNKSTSALSFTLTQAATVYVGYDPRAKTLPAWMNGFQKQAIQLGINDPNITNLVLYSKNFPAGKVTLGGNLASPASGALNMYLVIAILPPAQYNLTVTANGNGTVTKNPNQATYASGTSVTLTATPAAGQQFTGWSGDASGTTNPLTVSADFDKTIIANFAPIVQRTLTITTNGSGTVTKNPDQPTYGDGSSVILTAVPAAGQQFAGWSGAITSTTNPLTVVMDADKSITATFIPIQYSLTVTANGNGTVAKNPDQPTYASGSSVILTATPAAGQQFTGWSGAATGTTNPLTIVMDANKSVTATFAPIPPQYNLTVTVNGNGTVSKSPDQLTYTSGTSVTLTATPAAGQQFTGWSGAVTSTTNPLTITMDSNKSITANFAPIPPQYGLTVTISGNGTVSKNPDQATYASGTNVVLTATPAAGQQFAGWSGAVTGTTNPLTITMNAAKSVTATFTPIQYALTVSISGNGTVSKNPSQPTYASGTNVVLTATPAAGQQFTGWSGAVTSTTNPLTITMDAAKSVTATFAPIQYSLTVSVNGNGTVTKNPDQPTYASGTNVVLTATPAAGQQFTGWSGAVTSTTNPLTITMDAAKSVTATFAPIQYALTVSVSGSGTVTKNPDQPTYASGTNVVLTATPAAGQQFTGWSGAATGTTNPLTITMDAAKSVTATFAPIQYSLTVTISGSGTVTKNPDQATYASGTTVTLTATPAAGQQFTGWSGAASGTTSPLTITMDAAKSVTATFAPVSTALITNVTATTSNAYTLGQLIVGTTIYTDRTYTATSVPAFLNSAPCIKTPNADKSSKATSLLSFNLTQPATVYIAYDPRATAVPTWLSTFQKLSTQVGFNDPNISGLTLYSKNFPAGNVTIGGNLASPGAGALDNYLVAAVQLAQYTLTTNNNGNGTVTKTPNQATYQSGTSVTLTATPAAGQQFNGWSGDATGISNPLTVLMNSNKSITANFGSSSKSVFFTQSSQTAEVDQGGSQDLLEYISTSDNIPASAKLTAVDEGGNVPTWLSVNNVILNGISYTTNSEITFTFDATNLSIGTYSATISAVAQGYNNAVLNVMLTVKQGAGGVLTSLKVNFQDSVTAVPAGFVRDFGQAFGPRKSAGQDSGYSYGWLKRANNLPLDLTKNGRNRATPSDVTLATLMHMQAGDIANFNGTRVEGIWELQVTNGNYDVTVSVGDGTAVDSKHSINVEGVPAISNFVPTTSVRFKSATVTVSVADGFLTIDAGGGTNTKINYAIIKPSTSKRPSVVDVNPENSSQNVSENTSISTSILNLPNGGIDNSTITTANVYLSEAGTGAIIPANVNGTGGGDAITLVPLTPLKLTTTYNFNITSGVKDLSGAAFIPYTSSFKTGSGSTSETIAAKFDKISLPNAKGNHSSLTIGPDGKLYALSIDGLIKRFTINADGTLGTPDSLYSLQDEYGTRKETLAISLVFDPASTANNLIAWVTHCGSYVFLNAPPWDGKLTKLSGPNLQTAQDVLINLPRSAKDHVTNSIAFGPDGKLYFTQASTSAMGSADKTWNNRNECLLSATVLRLDVSKLGNLPLDVKTPDGGGTYNPYAANAPLTIYASGIRNAYDLIWHSNGNLYTPTNGSAAGGNTPASVNGTLRPDGSTYNGPVIPALTNVQQTQKDFLFRVVKGGYYGHPNPLRGEYVMNGGNPTASIDPAQVNAYPVGTLPDANYRGYAFDFQNNASPNGAIEYKSNTFNGALKGKILVVRYSQHDDIITLTPGGPDNDIISSIDGISIPGFSGFNDPLNLTEDLKTGNLYVSEYGGGKIDLLRVNNSSSRSSNTANVIADAFVRSDSYRDANYGSDTTLAVKGNTASAGLKRLSYFKFPLTKVSNVASAKLRLYGSNQEDATKVNVSVFSVADDSWEEKTITYRKSPVGSTSPISTVGVSNVAKYYDFDVTSFVRSEAAGDQIVSFLVKDANNRSKKIVFNSRENARFKPELVIVTNDHDTITLGGSPTTTTAATVNQNTANVVKSTVNPKPVVVTSRDSASLISLEETPYLAEHNFEKPKLYPNPLHNKFYIEFPSKYQGNFELQIIDMLGHIYHIGKTKLNVGGSNMEVNISRLALTPGVYFLKIIPESSKTDVIKLMIR